MHRGAVVDGVFPTPGCGTTFYLGSGKGQKLGEDEGIPGSTGAMDRHDRAVRQVYAAIERRDGRRIPFPDLAGINAGQHGTASLQRGTRQLRQVGYNQLRRDRQRYVEDVGIGSGMIIGHVRIRCADLHMTRDGLTDA
jgi:hypothetical protein